MKLDNILRNGVEECSNISWNTPECAAISSRINELNNEIKLLIPERVFFDLDSARGEQLAFVEQKAYEQGFHAASKLIKEMFFK